MWAAGLFFGVILFDGKTFCVKWEVMIRSSWLSRLFGDYFYTYLLNKSTFCFVVVFWVLLLILDSSHNRHRRLRHQTFWTFHVSRISLFRISFTWVLFSIVTLDSTIFHSQRNLFSQPKQNYIYSYFGTKQYWTISHTNQPPLSIHHPFCSYYLRFPLGVSSIGNCNFLFDRFIRRSLLAWSPTDNGTRMDEGLHHNWFLISHEKYERAGFHQK